MSICLFHIPSSEFPSRLIEILSPWIVLGYGVGISVSTIQAFVLNIGRTKCYLYISENKINRGFYKYVEELDLLPDGGQQTLAKDTV